MKTYGQCFQILMIKLVQLICAKFILRNVEGFVPCDRFNVVSVKTVPACFSTVRSLCHMIINYYNTVFLVS